MRDKSSKQRLFVFIGVLGAVMLFLTAYLFYFMVLAQTDTTEVIRQPPLIERGTILDRNGEELALQPELYSVEAWLPHLENPSETAALLSQILSLDRQVLLQKFSGEKKAVVVKHLVTPTESTRIENQKKEGKLKGIYLKPKMGRIYPQQELACHVLGYVNVDNIGMAGIEYTFENDLSPKNLSSVQPVYGNQIILSIDIKLQYFMDRLALQAFDKNRADSVMILVMEATTGELLAYTSIPRFDPNEFSKYSDSERMNRPTLMAYEPGSALKIFTLSSMLESGAVKTSDHFHCNGFYVKELSNGQEIKILCVGAHGDVIPQEIIKYSCNAGAAYASEKIQAAPFYEKLKSFGFGSRTGIVFAGESSGLFASPGSWSLRTKPTIAFGQEISVSAIQMVSAATVFANEGILLKPIIVKKVVSPDGRTVIKNFTREPVRRVLSPENAKQMLAMMETATDSNGSAYTAKIEGISVAAKTGTAQVSEPSTGTYSKDKYIASTIGLFPVGDPRIILYVVIQNPKEGSYWGSRIAAPVFKQAAEEIILYLDIPKAGETIYTQSGQLQLPKPNSIKIGSILPYLQGAPKRSLYPLFAAGLDVSIIGEGYVVSQEPPAGTRIEKGTKVILKLQ